MTEEQRLNKNNSVHAVWKKTAKTILKAGRLKILPMEYRNTLLENLTSVETGRNTSFDKLNSMKEEDATSLA
jgi:hypothetical protein